MNGTEKGGARERPDGAGTAQRPDSGGAGGQPARSARPGGRTRHDGWALLATSLGFGVVQLGVSVVNVVIKPIGADLDGGVSGLQWVVGAYTLTFGALILSAGALGDRIGAKPREPGQAWLW